MAADAAAADGPVDAQRTLALFNTHTGESLVAQYYDDGQYRPGVLEQLNTLLRDFRSGETHPIDPRLFDKLHRLALLADCEPSFEVISGYRSPATNSMLRARSSGVARHSLHMQGMAIDVRLAGCSCRQLRDLALGMRSGGVGYYAKSDFVHLDTGPQRFWSG